ncbi:uncharacterized protein METZ01_LOCUS247927 [marine metagenome]|uniref:Uncharacterized protein n=1 Tax=marine metagenome TaxID=408172 RepID=A0A382I857_9ZZZZ
MINPISKIDAVRSLFGRDSYDVCRGDGYVKWKDGHTTTAEETAQIDAEETRLQAVYDSQAYARSRKTEYPTIEECVHAILDDDLTALQVKRQAVKDKYPKE